MISLPNVHYAESMKGALMSVSDRLLLRKRAIIETMNDELKNIVQVEYSKHRCLKKSSSTYSGQLLPIICSQRSRASMCKGPLTHSLHCSEFVELTLNKRIPRGFSLPNVHYAKDNILGRKRYERRYTS